MTTEKSMGFYSSHTILSENAGGDTTDDWRVEFEENLRSKYSAL